MTGPYEVGFGKPPQHTRFRKGQSGNPNGRPKGTKNLKTDLLEELTEQIHVREGNRERSLSKQRALVKSIIAKGIKGDTRAANILLNLIIRLLDDQASDPVDHDLPSEDRELLEAYVARRAPAAASAAASAPAGPSAIDASADGAVESADPEGSRVKP